jgi:hypothetical protein
MKNFGDIKMHGATIKKGMYVCVYVCMYVDLRICKFCYSALRLRMVFVRVLLLRITNAPC